jgi:hypothetical protein
MIDPKIASARGEKRGFTILRRLAKLDGDGQRARHRTRRREMTESKKIRVNIEITVEVDVDAYNAEYGVTETVAEIRESIKSSAVSAVDSDLNSTFAKIAKWR